MKRIVLPVLTVCLVSLAILGFAGCSGENEILTTPTWHTLASGTTATLNSVWGTSASNAFAVGSAGTILHYNGATWTQMVNPATTQTLNGVWGIDSTHVYAVGNSGAVSDTFLFYNGTTWSQVPTSAHINRPLYTVLTAGGQLLTAGAEISGSYDGTEMVLQEAPGQIIYDSFAFSNGAGVLVGLISDPATGVPTTNISFVNWSTTPDFTNPAPTTTLYGVWGTSPGNIYFAGENGTLMHFNGTTMSLIETGTTQTLRGIWGSGSENVFVVGDAGTILRFNGEAWSRIDAGTSANLRDVWGWDGVHVFAVGDNGVILDYSY